MQRAVRPGVFTPLRIFRARGGKRAGAGGALKPGRNILDVRVGIAENLAFGDRLILAAVFLVAGSTKMLDRDGSVRALREFGIPGVLAAPAGALLPVAELGVAIALLIASAAWYAAWGALGLLALFFVAAAWNLVRGRKPDCHCFGRLHSKPVSSATLGRSGLLALCAAWLVTRGASGEGPGAWEFFRGLNGAAHNFAVLALGAGCLAFFIALDRAKPAVIVSEAVETDEPAPTRRAAAATQRAPAPRPALEEDSRKWPQNVGLEIGTKAPEFELTGITGQTHTLASLLAPGKTLMLLFSSPHCQYCVQLLPDIGKWMREEREWLQIALISRGTAEENREKVQGFGIDEVLLQKASEVADAYDSSSNPSAVLIDGEGKIVSQLITNSGEVRKLVETRRPGEINQGPEAAE